MSDLAERGFHTRHHGQGTSVTQSFPWGFYITAKALCADGKVRRVKRIAQTADTFFSVPASVEVRKDGKRYTVAGYITFEEANDGERYVRFRAYTYCKNHAVLAEPEKVTT